jgi:hypothetical protein
MFVYCKCCVLSGRGLCDELITRPEESYRLWCVVVCDLENLRNEEAMTRVGSQLHSRKKNACVRVDVVSGPLIFVLFSPQRRCRQYCVPVSDPCLQVGSRS